MKLVMIKTAQALAAIRNKFPENCIVTANG
jgi:hypothetical protein